MNEAAIIEAIVGSRGNQIRRKDRDTMSDVGGVSKVREREPEHKPPRDDMKEIYRKKDRPSGDRDTDTDNDKDMKASVASRIAKSVVGANTKMMAKSVLSQYPTTLKAVMSRM